MQEQASDVIYQEFVRFLEQPFPMGTYNDRLQNKDLKSLVISFEHLRQYNHVLVDGILNQPVLYYPSLCRAVDESASNYGVEKKMVGLMGIMADHHVTPRGLRSNLLNKMVCVDCIVTKSALTKPKLKKSLQISSNNNRVEKLYNDGNGINDEVATSTTLPTHDKFGDALELQPGLSQYENHQFLIVQEIPELTPAGQLPRSIDVMLSGHLCDSVKPGDRIQVVGFYRTMGGKMGNFKKAIVAVHINLLNKTASSTKVSPDEISEMKRLVAEEKNVVELLSRSIAPSIYGNEIVKKGLLLSLLGGVEKHLNQGGRLRGSINVLMVGDPSVGKSQLLRYLTKVAPLSVSTTGRGASGVGLTAAVSHDQESGEKTLEAGACVLADQGHVLLDEFDKMSDIDRVAIHEVMEQQSITIAKAGICVTLNARCSMIAAANPVYGLYDESIDPARNIHLPDSLLSRFDLLFIMLDRPNEVHDSHLATHVLKNRRFVPDQYEVGQVMEDTPLNYMMEPKDNQDEIVESIITVNGVRVLSSEFLKKYIWYARSVIKPILSDEAARYITQKYGNLRNSNYNQKKTLPVTVRSLETMIRLSTAFAKARLSNTINKKDAEAAFKMLKLSLFKEVVKHRPTKKVKQEQAASDDDDIDSGDDNDDDNDAMDLDEQEKEIVHKTRSKDKPSTGAAAPEDAESYERYT
eukprot:NODE_84_length_22354_cov_0.646506.p2 type:complete len:692 gc:universal NODE_84_length_22354_cov_0.646506:16746-14671(-)